MKYLKENKKALFICAAGLAVCVGLCLLLGIPLIRFASEPERFRLWVNENAVLSRFAYIGMVVFQIMLPFLPGEPFEMVAGYAFGTIEGTALCLLSEALGSILVLSLVRKYGVRLVSLFFREKNLSEVKFLKSSKKQVLLLTLLFTLPGTPKDLLCFFAGLTDIRLPVLYIICSITRIPAVVTSTVGGDMLGDQNYVFAIAVFAATFLLSISGLIIYNAICNKKRENS